MSTIEVKTKRQFRIAQGEGTLVLEKEVLVSFVKENLICLDPHPKEEAKCILNTLTGPVDVLESYETVKAKLNQ